MRQNLKLMLLAVSCGVVIYFLPAAPLKFAEHVLEAMALIHLSLEVLRKP
jgi:hypothetical protein